MDRENNSGLNSPKLTALDVQQVIQRGDFERATILASEVLESSPNDIYCLSVVANSAFSSGNLDEAKGFLLKALENQPGELNLNRNLGLICNKQGEFNESVEAFVRGIENNPQHPELLLDFMLLGISLNKISNKLSCRVIEVVFSSSLALRNAYMSSEELPLIVDASSIANSIVRDAKYQSQKNALDELSLGFSDQEKLRIYEFLDIFHGVKAPVYVDDLQKPAYHFFPGLKPVPFYNSDDYSWSEVLKKNWHEIRRELFALYENHSHVKPYIDGVKTGVEDLDKLADSLDWSSIHLIQAGQYNHDLLNHCPITKAALSELPMPVLDGNAPEVFLSVLKPGAEIKPHFGLSNIKQTVHLGLQIPDGCAIRVGNETQTWQEGEILIFDDSFEHEAWNRSDEERKVLILEVWHPDLTVLEKQGIQKIMELEHGVSQLTESDSIESLLEEISGII